MKCTALRLCTFVVAGALAVACARTDDAQITANVKARLIDDETVKARQIDVDTRNRVVTLSGTVETAVEEERALTLARNTSGVSDVVDQIEVRGPAEESRGTAEAVGEAARDVGGAMSDASITAAVKAKLLADTDVAGLRLDVDTDGGIVTLTGNVRSEAEKTRALALAREVKGVQSVVDRITLKPR